MEKGFQIMAMKIKSKRVERKFTSNKDFVLDYEAHMREESVQNKIKKFSKQVERKLKKDNG
jgi:hypothetical protein